MRDMGKVTVTFDFVADHREGATGERLWITNVEVSSHTVDEISRAKIRSAALSGELDTRVISEAIADIGDEGFDYSGAYPSDDE